MWSMVCMTVWLFVSSIMDVKSRRVPVWMLSIGCILTMVTVWYQGCGGVELLKGMLPGALLLFVAFVTKKAGYGDGVVLAYLGMALGGERSLLLFGLSLFMLSLCALILLALHRVGRNTAIPFLPFLTTAWLAVMWLQISGS